MTRKQREQRWGLARRKRMHQINDSWKVRFAIPIFISALFISVSSTSADKIESNTSLQTSRREFASNLPVVRLEVKVPLVPGQKEKVPGSFSIAKPPTGGADELTNLSAMVRYHGASSLSYPKKSYRVSLEKPVPLLDLRTHTDWVLNAAHVDRSFMRHKLSYDLFRSLSGKNGERFAVASRFVELMLNGEYHGVYLLMERVDDQLLELRRFNSNEVHHACIYKAVDHISGFSHGGHLGFEQHEPNPITHPDWLPLREFNKFVSLAPDSDFLNPTNGIDSHLDLGNTIDFHLLILLTSNMDGFDKNFILARNAPVADLPQPKFFFAPWDYDATFGRNWEGSRVSPKHWLSNGLFDRLLRNEDYRKRFVARWKELRAREFSVAKIHSMIETNRIILGDAPDRNAARWFGKSCSAVNGSSFDRDLDEMKEWVIARTQWLDQQMNGLGSR